MQESGAQERAAGIAEYQAAKGASSYAQGTKHRISGKADEIRGSVTGNRALQTEGQFFGIPFQLHSTDISSLLGKQRHDQGVEHQKWNRRN